MSFLRVSSESSENILPLPWILVGVGVFFLGLLIVGCAVHRIRRKIKSKALLCGSTNLNKKHLQNCFSNDKPENFHLLFFVVAEIIEYNLFYNMN